MRKGIARVAAGIFALLSTGTIATLLTSDSNNISFYMALLVVLKAMVALVIMLVVVGVIIASTLYAINGELW